MGECLRLEWVLIPQDLIIWEFVEVLGFPPCKVRLVLSCGQIPDGEHLPRSCINIGVPATFTVREPTGKTGANAESTEAGTAEDEISESSSSYLVKFFENGEYSVEGLRWGRVQGESWCKILPEDAMMERRVGNVDLLGVIECRSDESKCHTSY